MSKLEKFLVMIRVDTISLQIPSSPAKIDARILFH